MLKKTSLELEEDLWRAAKQRALDDDVDLRTVIITALEQYLGRQRKPRKEDRHAKQ